MERTHHVEELWSLNQGAQALYEILASKTDAVEADVQSLNQTMEQRMEAVEAQLKVVMDLMKAWEVLEARQQTQLVVQGAQSEREVQDQDQEQCQQQQQQQQEQDEVGNKGPPV